MGEPNDTEYEKLGEQMKVKLPSDGAIKLCTDLININLVGVVFIFLPKDKDNAC